MWKQKQHTFDFYDELIVRLWLYFLSSLYHNTCYVKPVNGFVEKCLFWDTLLCVWLFVNQQIYYVDGNGDEDDNIEDDDGEQDGSGAGDTWQRRLDLVGPLQGKLAIFGLFLFTSPLNLILVL